MAIGDAFTQNVPVVGDSGTQYAADVNEVLTELISRVSSDVPYSALSGSSLDLDNVPVLDAQYVQLYEQGSAPDTAVTGRLYRYANNLYWVHPSGILQLTNGTSVNVSSAGGFSGDYISAAATAKYVDASTRYEFYDDTAGTIWAYTRSRGNDISAGASSTSYVQLRYGGAGTYTWTYPATLPASNRSVLVINASGQVEDNDATNTVQNDIHLDPTSNAKIRHGDRVIVIAPTTGSSTASAAYNTGGGIVCSGTGDTYFGISGLQTNWRVKTLLFRLNKSSAGVTTINFNRTTHSTGVGANLATNTNSTSGVTTLLLTLGTPEVVAVDRYYHVQWTNLAATDSLQSIELTYDIV